MTMGLGVNETLGIDDNLGVHMGLRVAGSFRVNEDHGVEVCQIVIKNVYTVGGCYFEPRSGRGFGVNGCGTGSIWGP